MSVTYLLPEAEDARAFGAALAGVLSAGDVLVLTGDLGAGKTTLTQGLGEGLAVRGRVTSPTFTISRIHPATAGGPDLVHVDAYRLSDLYDLETVDLESTMATAITVIEWGEALIGELTDRRVQLTLERPEPAADPESGDDPAGGVRRARLDFYGGPWDESRIRGALAAFAST
ncbi:MAG: tRNA (adenosine(37)-N6)-threonylcarbamoyltransferase complex ATPase subunit type 1 TsaE [Bowdeniella nasicola]|nr:tRNA (adenosine(37)-N6)-threonylcarbamoyltransferase complex ATPase subunit type 1 TsaE [Bowdeniella nasicola]